jgi:hypothetical protein
MAKVINIKNISGINKTYAGQTILDAETYSLSPSEVSGFSKDVKFFQDVSSGDIIINNGLIDILDPIDAWDHVINDIKMVTITQMNPDLGGKVSVHSSSKPDVEGSHVYAVWSGSGDSPDPNIVGGGDLLQFQLTIGKPFEIKDVIFNHAAFGRVWIHEAYLKFANGGIGDYVSAYIMSNPTPLQQVASLDLVLEERLGVNFVKYSPSGPGTGTHGFAANPILIPRLRTKDGDWDYNETDGLVPNFTGTGEYLICEQEYAVSKYINKIPCFGSTSNYFTMSSDETAEVPPGYFVRVKCVNNSNSNWNLSVIMELFREQTVN